jgi:hypothetical protein
MMSANAHVIIQSDRTKLWVVCVVYARSATQHKKEARVIPRMSDMGPKLSTHQQLDSISWTATVYNIGSKLGVVILTMLCRYSMRFQTRSGRVSSLRSYTKSLYCMFLKESKGKVNIFMAWDVHNYKARRAGLVFYVSLIP